MWFSHDLFAGVADDAAIIRDAELEMHQHQQQQQSPNGANRAASDADDDSCDSASDTVAEPVAFDQPEPTDALPATEIGGPASRAKNAAGFEEVPMVKLDPNVAMMSPEAMMLGTPVRPDGVAVPVIVGGGCDAGHAPDAVASHSLRAGHLLVNQKKRRSELIDDSYNRYAFNDQAGLPAWFADDEKRHMRPEIPITREVAEEYRRRMQELNARPMRKVLEARMRKKMRMMRQRQKATQAAQAIATAADLNEAQKARQIERIVAKSMAPAKRRVEYVVARKSRTMSHGPRSRPGGGKRKGPYKMVDARLRKDKRAAERAAGSKRSRRARR